MLPQSVLVDNLKPHFSAHSELLPLSTPSAPSEEEEEDPQEEDPSESHRTSGMRYWQSLQTASAVPTVILLTFSTSFQFHGHTPHKGRISSPRNLLRSLMIPKKRVSGSGTSLAFQNKVRTLQTPFPQ
jgi:hypothetical protein